MPNIPTGFGLPPGSDRSGSPARELDVRFPCRQSFQAPSPTCKRATRPADLPPELHGRAQSLAACLPRLVSDRRSRTWRMPASGQTSPGPAACRSSAGFQLPDIRPTCAAPQPVRSAPPDPGLPGQLLSAAARALLADPSVETARCRGYGAIRRGQDSTPRPVANARARPGTRRRAVPGLHSNRELPSCAEPLRAVCLLVVALFRLHPAAPRPTNRARGLSNPPGDS